MVAINKVVDEYTFRARAEGGDATKRSTDGLSKSQGELARSTEAASASGERATRSRLTMADALARQQRQAEMAARQAQQMAAIDAQVTASNLAVAASLDRIAQAQADAARAATAASQQSVKAANDNGKAQKESESLLKAAAKTAIEQPALTAAALAVSARYLSGFAATASTSLAGAPKALSDTQAQLGQIKGQAVGLKQTLVDLGMSANGAAKAIRERAKVAIDGLRDSFRADLTAKTNDAKGLGYVNDTADLVKERTGLLADAKALGLSSTQVERYFTAAAQKIVDEAGLTGRSFDDLTEQFPALRGHVVEFGEAVDSAADKVATAARRLGYDDRAFAARTDTSTRSGALAAFDRDAAKQRADEAKAGNGALSDLERALATERLGIVKDFAQKTLEAEKAAAEAAATRTRNYADRLFTAGNDTSTLKGQLAAYERQAGQELIEERKAGGTELLALEKTQAAERNKIIKDFNDQAIVQQKQAFQEAKDFLATAVKNIKAYLDDLTAGSGSPLSPADRLATAQSQFTAQKTLAQGGDRDALSGITGYASNVLEAAKAQYASGPQYQTIFNSIKDSLAALPKQVSAEQFIVDAVNAGTTATQAAQAALLAAVQANSAPAIATALNANFNKIDTNLNGKLSSAEFLAGLGPLATKQDQKDALVYFKTVDLNGDGVITKLEAVRASITAAVQTNSPAAIAAALNANFNMLDTNLNRKLSSAEYLSGLSPLATKDEQVQAKAVFKSIDTNADGQLSKQELIRAQTASTATNTGNTKTSVDNTKSAIDDNTTVSNAMKTLLSTINSYTSATRDNIAASNSFSNSIKAYTDATRDNIAASNGILNAINSLSGLQRDQLVALNGQFSLNNSLTLGGRTLNNNIVTALNKIVYNTASLAAYNEGGTYAYSTGGWVSGPGTATSDSVKGLLSTGEFVVRAAQAKAYGPMLEAMNDNRGLPMAVAAMAVSTPLAGGIGGGDLSALIAEVRALRAEVKRQAEMMARVTMAGSDKVASRVERAAGAVEEGNADRRKGQRSGAGVAGRGGKVAA